MIDRPGRDAPGSPGVELEGLEHAAVDDQFCATDAFIDLLESAGFPLAEIARFVAESDGDESSWRAMTSDKVRQLDEQIEQIKQAQVVLRHQLDCRHEQLDYCPEHRHIGVPDW